jgi:Tat protein translocase TatB subunit
MLDIGWWELLVVGMVALVVVGPRELPTLLRTIGRYVGMAKRQADEFRSQFDDALRESEFNDLRNEMNEIKSDVTTSMDEAQQSLNKELSETDYDWDAEEKIKPAPEFDDDEEATSFTMPDGEVVNKNNVGEVVNKENDGEVEADGAASGDAIATTDTPDTTTATSATTDDQTERPRDAETVR